MSWDFLYGVFWHRILKIGLFKLGFSDQDASELCTISSDCDSPLLKN